MGCILCLGVVSEKLLGMYDIVIWFVTNVMVLQRQTIPSWITYCIGLEVAMEEASGLFVEVLWRRFQGKDNEAHSLLDQLQRDLLERQAS